MTNSPGDVVPAKHTYLNGLRGLSAIEFPNKRPYARDACEFVRLSCRKEKDPVDGNPWSWLAER